MTPSNCWLFERLGHSETLWMASSRNDPSVHEHTWAVGGNDTFKSQQRFSSGSAWVLGDFFPRQFIWLILPILADKAKIAFWYFPFSLINRVSSRDLKRKEGKGLGWKGPERVIWATSANPLKKFQVLKEIGRLVFIEGSCWCPHSLSLLPAKPLPVPQPQILQPHPSFPLPWRGGRESAFRLESVSCQWVLRM